MEIRNADADAAVSRTASLGSVQAHDGEREQSPASRFMRISEIERTCDPASPAGRILQWLREFIARPHPMLGRAGPVCPLVPASLAMDSIWIKAVTDENPSMETISAIITECRNVFLETEPRLLPAAMNKAFLVLFPSIGNGGTEAAAIIDKVQYSLKKHFVDMGLMLGEFHAANESPGLRNPDFRPLRSPVPMLAIRHMVESDLPFLARESYPPIERRSFLRSYLFRLGGALSQPKFDEAMKALIVAEVGLLTARTRAGETTLLSALFEPASAVDEQLTGTAS
jgi:hypothetical protein